MRMKKILKALWWLVFAVAALVFVITGIQEFPFGPMSSAEETVRAYAAANGLHYRDYPDSLIALLDRNPETKTFVLEYPIKKHAPQEVDLSSYSTEEIPLFLQWDQQWGYRVYGDDFAAITGCGPMCLSMVAYSLTGNAAYSPEKMLDFASKNGYYASGYGSSWTLISEGGAKLGFQVTELPLVKKKIFDNLEAGNPVITVVGPGDFTSTGHFLVLTGVKDGMIQINDPNSIENSQKLWSYEALENQIKNIWAIQGGA